MQAGKSSLTSGVRGSSLYFSRAQLWLCPWWGLSSPLRPRRAGEEKIHANKYLPHSAGALWAGNCLNPGSLRPKPCPLHSTCCLSAKLAAGRAHEPQVVSLCNCPQATQPELSSLWDEQTGHHIADLRRRCCPGFPALLSVFIILANCTDTTAATGPGLPTPSPLYGLP